jgi:3-deoxy-D-manno-octulosonic acid kinase
VNPRSDKQALSLIVYDADRIQHPQAQIFDVDFWKAQGCVVGAAVGRGSAWFLQAPFGAAVLREYLRGGWPGRFIRDRYFFTGWSRSRPVAEFDMLVELHRLGLPVPRPLAALTRRRGLFYRGCLLTERIPGARTVADLMAERSADDAFWARIGAGIRRFHDHGVVHADLNARNILIDERDTVFLIDFDRARRAPGANARFAANLGRLRRSFDKLWPESGRGRLDDCWTSLEQGYVAA